MYFIRISWDVIPRYSKVSKYLTKKLANPRRSRVKSLVCQVSHMQQSSSSHTLIIFAPILSPIKIPIHFSSYTLT